MENTPLNLERLLTTAEVAEMLNVTESTLRAWRFKRYPLAYVKAGRKMVRYRAADVAKFIDDHTVKPAT